MQSIIGLLLQQDTLIIIVYQCGPCFWFPLSVSAQKISFWSVTRFALSFTCPLNRSSTGMTSPTNEQHLHSCQWRRVGLYYCTCLAVCLWLAFSVTLLMIPQALMYKLFFKWFLRISSDSWSKKADTCQSFYWNPFFTFFTTFCAIMAETGFCTKS